MTQLLCQLANELLSIHSMGLELSLRKKCFVGVIWKQQNNDRAKAINCFSIDNSCNRVYPKNRVKGMKEFAKSEDFMEKFNRLLFVQLS